MRTTVDLDADILQTARELAAARKTTIGKVISDLARRSLQPPTETNPLRNGVPVLSSRPEARVVSLEDVNRLRDETGPSL